MSDSFTFVLFMIALGVGYYFGVSQDKPVQEPSRYCEANEIKAFFDSRTHEFHKGELNAMQYKDSLYSDLQKHMIFNKR